MAHLPRIVLALLLLGTALPAAEPTLQVEPIAVPTRGESLASSISMSPDGIGWLVWLERAETEVALRTAVFNAARRRWSDPVTITGGADVFANVSDPPVVSAGTEGRAAVLWFVNHPEPSHGSSTASTHGHHGPNRRAVYSLTTDHGATWSAPTPVTRESDATEFASLTTLADGRVLAAWLDTRAKAHGGPQQLFARVLGDSSPDQRLDDSVCDCCHTALTSFPDGSALLAYRGRTQTEVRDIRLARFVNGQWSAPQALHADNWTIAGCPVNGPQLASDGGRVAVAWFTAAGDNPRVLAATSANAGGNFLNPLTVNEDKPSGRVSTVLLHDGAMFVSWLDPEGSLWLRRLAPEFRRSTLLQLTAGENGRVRGAPRLALLRDYAGEKTNAELLVTFTREDRTRGNAVHTLLVTVPEGELLEAEKSCDCAPAIEDLQGFPLRGTVVAAPANGHVQIAHDAVPGIFAAGERRFAFPGQPADLFRPGQRITGRFEREGTTWRLFGVRAVGPESSR